MGRNSYYGCGTKIDPRREERARRRREEAAERRKKSKETAPAQGGNAGVPETANVQSKKYRNRRPARSLMNEAKADRILKKKEALAEKRALAMVRDNPALTAKLAQLKMTSPTAYWREIGKILAGKRL